MFNADHVTRMFSLPAVAKSEHWKLFVDTSAATPHDVYPNADGPEPPKSGRIKLPDRSLRCFVACAPESSS
jgi:glycogen operon protein